MRYASIGKDVLFANFVRAEYVSLMKECVEEEKTKSTKTFKPLYDVWINNATSDVQAARLLLIAQAVAEDAGEVQRRLPHDS